MHSIVLRFRVIIDRSILEIAGIKRIVYNEPYPKSLVFELHDDIHLGRPEYEDNQKVTVESFRGIAPRMYPILFSSKNTLGMRIKRKDYADNIDEKPAGLRSMASSLNYIQREATAVAILDKLFKRPEEINDVNTELRNGS